MPEPGGQVAYGTFRISDRVGLVQFIWRSSRTPCILELRCTPAFILRAKTIRIAALRREHGGEFVGKTVCIAGPARREIISIAHREA
jgi:hypothetical protein